MTMTPEKALTVYAMVGPMGSGKTTLAHKISAERGARFFSLDQTIQDLGLPINDLADYERHMVTALVKIGAEAARVLQSKRPVVLDFGGGLGHWEWLKSLADSAEAFVEIYHFEIPLDVRIARVRKRNEEKPAGIYHFTMSDEEVTASKPTRETPESSDRVKIIKVTA